MTMLRKHGLITIKFRWLLLRIYILNYIDLFFRIHSNHKLKLQNLHNMWTDNDNISSISDILVKEFYFCNLFITTLTGYQIYILCIGKILVKHNKTFYARVANTFLPCKKASTSSIPQERYVKSIFLSMGSKEQR